MRHFRINDVEPREAVYLGLSSDISSQLRDAYAKRNEAGEENQTTLAAKIGVGRSSVNKVLTGQRNLTEKTIADFVWALDYAIKVTIYDPRDTCENSVPRTEIKMPPIDPIQLVDETAGPVPVTQTRIRQLQAAE